MLKQIAMAIGAMVVAVALTACSGPIPNALSTVIAGDVANPVTPKMVLELRAGYDAAVLVPAAHYAALPRCSRAPAPCSEQSIVNQLRRLDAVVKPAIEDAARFALANRTIDARAAYDIAVAGITNAERIASAYKIGG